MTSQSSEKLNLQYFLVLRLANYAMLVIGVYGVGVYGVGVYGVGVNGVGVYGVGV